MITFLKGFIVTNGSTKIYLEASLSTPTQSDRSVIDGQSAKAFHQRNFFIPMSYILLVNNSTGNILYNPALLWNIRASSRTLYLTCNYGTVPVNQVGNSPGYGQVWYQPKGISNILVLSNITNN